jgi:hypothetical protein
MESAEISADANLEYSLSPPFPPAFLKHGRYGWQPSPARWKETQAQY